MAKFVTCMSFHTQMKTQMKTTRVLNHISKLARVIFICLLIVHQDSWIKTKKIEHNNNTSV